MRLLGSGDTRRALRISTLVVVLLVPVELALRPFGVGMGIVVVLACLVPWRPLIGLPPAGKGTIAWSWRLLGIGIAMASVGTWLLQILDAPTPAMIMVPVLLTLPATVWGGWGVLVRPGASLMTVLDLLLVVLALVLMSWTWLLDDLTGADPTEATAIVATFATIVFFASLAVAGAMRDSARAVELVALAMAMAAFAVALLRPTGGALQAYGLEQVHTLVGYGLAVFAIVHGQLNTTPRSVTTGGPLGGPRAAAGLVVGAFIVNAAITDAAGITANPVEGVLQALLLLAMAARVVVTSRAWNRTHTELDHRVHTDALTGLHNRLWLTSHLEAQLADLTEHGPTSVAMIDLDRFKIINDSLGHLVGDAVLNEAAERIRDACAPHDVVRFGGDEFLVVIPPSTPDPTAVADRARRALAAPFDVGGRALPMSASVGLATAQPDADPVTLVRDADAAMYHAKELGRDRVVIFDTSLREASFRRLVMENGLRAAVDDGTLSLAYQPVVDASTGQVMGAEALLRWNSPVLGPVSPGEFIQVAEEIGAIGGLGQWVIDRACVDLAELDRTLGPAAVPQVSVNLSGIQLLSPTLVDDISRSLARHGLARDRMILEVTESALLDEKGLAAATLHALSTAGFRLAVDDFGTGYSALSYLETFPVDVLKIDRSFVTPLGRDEAPLSRSMIPTLVRIAELLGMQVVAEGVETTAERDALIGMGAMQHQGYLYDRPMSVEALAALLAPVRVS